ncbi:tonsoku-like protein [Phlebotomus argentipes]|uniref:tonsoku-like protein n=1 Tax=Phlebotomus argentipes TaxID=94469 RepID=UPI002892BED0|nr:tonsoku-like protein [Phlebotomus argentipes]
MENKLLAKKRKATQEKNVQQIATSCHNLGNFYHESGQYDKALQEYKAEAEQWKVQKNQMKYGIAHRMIGEMLMLLGDVNKSLKHEHQYLKIAQEEKDSIEVQRAYATIGRAYLLKGQNLTEKESAAERAKALKDAERAFLKSLSICRELPGKISNTELQDMMARLYLNLSVTKENCSEEIEKSLEYMTKAIAICKSHDLYELLHQCYMSTGLLYEVKKKDIGNSLRYLNLALDVAQRLEARTMKICETLLLKSEMLIKSGDYQSAKQTLHRAYKLKSPNEIDRETIEQKLKVVAALCYTEDSLITANSEDFRRKKDLYEKMGDGSCKLENYDKALSYYKKMLENAELSGESGKDLIPIYVSLYQTFRDNQNYKEALEYAWKEYELCKEVPQEAFLTLMNIAELSDLAEMDFWEVEKMYQRARKETGKTGDKKSEALAIGKLIVLQRKHGMDTLADLLEKEAQMSGMDMSAAAAEDEEAACDDGNVPGIGDDICLDDISDSGSEEDADIPLAVEQKRPMRRKRVTNVVKRNNKGESQLHQACISGNATLARRLLDQGHPVNIRDHAGWLPLHEACIHGHRDIVEMLLEKSCATINDRGGTSCDGITPIHDACSNGHLEIVELLLDKGANATVKTDFGDTPLDTLKIWRGTMRLEANEVAFYETIVQRLSKLMDKAGINPREVNLTNRRLAHALVDEDSSEGFPIERENSLSPPLVSTKNSAVAEDSSRLYKSVIDNLRKKKSANEEPKSEVLLPKKRSAYLEGDEVGEDWLEDDLLPNKKRRKFLKDSREFCTPKQKKTKPVIQESEDNEMEDLVIEEPEIRETPPRRVTQTSLIDAGFSRQQIDVDLDFPLNISPGKSSRSSTGKSPCVPLIVHNMISVKVKIDDQLIVVPVNAAEVQNLQIKWLTERASKRYYNLHGRLPEMLLTTTDGAVFDDQDPISLVIDNDQNLVHSLINKWNVLSLAESYKDVAKQMENVENVQIVRALEVAENSNELILADLDVPSKETRALFKAIQHHVNLSAIDLSRNIIEDEGLVYLCQSLSSLKYLNVLNLSCNFLTENGLLRLANVLQETKEALLPELKDLNLSHNPLGNGSRKYLSIICEKLPKLRILNLSACDLTELGDCNLGFSHLDSLDLSFNTFKDAEELRTVWRLLDVTRVESIRLGFCLKSQGLGKQLGNFLQSGSPRYLTELHLQNCHLTDADLWTILKALAGREMQEIDLTQNPVTSLSLKYFLTTSISVAHVKFLGCEKILDNVSILEELPPYEGELHPQRITLFGRCIEEEMIEHLRKVWTSCWLQKEAVVERKSSRIIQLHLA